MVKLKSLRKTESKTREESCYVQNCEQFRCLNAQMNRVPALAMTLTGGLWFGAGATDLGAANTDDQDSLIRFALLMLAGFSNLALILIVFRTRDVMASYLERIEEFYPTSFARGIPKDPTVPRLGNNSMIRIFSALMLLAATFSFFGAFWSYWPFEFCCIWGVVILGILLLVLYCCVFRRNPEKEKQVRFGATMRHGIEND